MSSDPRTACPSDVLRPKNVGAPIKRPKIRVFLTGNGEYTADRKPGPAAASRVPAEQSTARADRTDCTMAAAEAPGVVAVLTAEDVADDFKPVIPFSRMPNYYATPILPLALGRRSATSARPSSRSSPPRGTSPRTRCEVIDVDYEPLGGDRTCGIGPR